MSAPQPDQRSVDDDPTGMRALLRGLPDPGPMPEHVAQRIQASLAAQPHPSASVVDLGHYRTHRGARKGPWLAAAAGLVAVVGGGLLTTGGPSQMIAALTGHNPVSASSDSMAASGASTAREGAADTSSAPVSTAGTAPRTVRVVMTNGAWTGVDLAPATERALASAAQPSPEGSSSLPDLGAVATAQGARDCATALGVPADAGVVVDLGTHEGQPAALLVATTGGERAAYLVGRNCRTGHSELRIGPQTHRV